MPVLIDHISVVVMVNSFHCHLTLSIFTVGDALGVIVMVTILVTHMSDDDIPGNTIYECHYHT